MLYSYSTIYKIYTYITYINNNSLDTYIKIEESGFFYTNLLQIKKYYNNKKK